MTQAIKIDLMQVEDVAEAIQSACDVREAAGLQLRGCFESSGELILVFQGTLNSQAVPEPPPNVSLAETSQPKV